MDVDSLEQVEQWHEEGWLVKLTFLPDGHPFVAQGSGSELAPEPDTVLKGTEGHISCELYWIKRDEPCPLRHQYPVPHGIGPTLKDAVERCRDFIERSNR